MRQRLVLLVLYVPAKCHQSIMTQYLPCSKSASESDYATIVQLGGIRARVRETERKELLFIASY